MANRKLQGEIERVFKKVEDGVSVFEQIWDKVYAATTTAQKEKYEGDLKKEIKKLQRLRDHIKTWQGDSSIKDKTKLDSYRKLIEEKMERFKVCEKETKTKAFSKEGLAQDRTDPKQKAKANVGDWVKEAISKLTEQCEEMEAENETLNSGKRKKRNDEHPRVTQNKEHIQRHQHHMEMLERVLRAVDNDAVTPEEAEELKESVDYYIDSNQDPDFYEDDEMYDALNLDAAPTPVSSSSATSVNASTTPTTSSANATNSNAMSNSNSNSAMTSANASATNTPTSSKKSKSSASANNNSSAAVSNSVNSTGDDADERSNSLASNSTPSSKKTPSSPRVSSSSKSGKNSSLKEGKIILSNRNSSPKNRRSNGGGGSNSHNMNGTMPEQTQISPRSPRKSNSRNSEIHSMNSHHSNAHPTLLSNVVRASGSSKGGGRNAGGVTNIASFNSSSSSLKRGHHGLAGKASTVSVMSASSTSAGANGGSASTPAANNLSHSNTRNGLSSSTNTNVINSSSSMPMPSLTLSANSDVNSANGVRGAAANTIRESTSNSNMFSTSSGPSATAASTATTTTTTTTTITTTIPSSHAENLSGSSSKTAAQLASSIRDQIQLQQQQQQLQLQKQGGAANDSASLPSSSIVGAKGGVSLQDVVNGRAGEPVVTSASGVTGSGGVARAISRKLDTPKTVVGDDIASMSKIDREIYILDGMLQYMPEPRETPTITQPMENVHQAQQASAASVSLPHPHSTSASMAATPRNPTDVPASFPSVPATIFDSHEVFQQFDLDTLFFIFYYQQGTYQQYLAASELKRQGWRFHKKYQTWFQRHDEPKVSTDEYETGTFIYFDYANVVVHGQGSGWCRRFKSEFRFEYRFLEDELI